MKNKIKLPSNKNFGIVFFVVFFIIGLWPLLDQSEPRYWSIFVSLVFFTLGILNSNILTPLNKIWFYFGITLGKIISPVVMGIIFFFVVTPTGIIMRLLGKDILNLKKNTNASYWVNKKKINTTMKRQF